MDCVDDDMIGGSGMGVVKGRICDKSDLEEKRVDFEEAKIVKKVGDQLHCLNCSSFYLLPSFIIVCLRGSTLKLFD